MKSNSVFIPLAGLLQDSLPPRCEAQLPVTEMLSRQLQQEGVCQRSFERVQFL
jgi:hypothetical protein